MILSERLTRNLKQTNLKPIIVLEIEGLPFLIGSDTIKQFLPRYGDENVFYGDEGITYGGMAPIGAQKTLISLEGTTTQIKQNLSPDKARGSGISQMTIALIDKNKEATKIAAGTYGEILFKRVKVWVSFGDTNSFNEDYILVFRGVIESVKSAQGNVRLNLNAPDQQKKQVLLFKADTTLNGAISNSQTFLNVAEIDNLFIVPDHPLYSPKDESLISCVRIDDEIIRYETISGTTLGTLTRGYLGTTAVAHSDESAVESFFLLEGNAVDLALKIMLSDKDQTPYIEDLEASAVNFDDIDVISNIIFFRDVNLIRDRNVQTGDYVQTSGFTQPANNLSSWTEIIDVVVGELGTYLILDATLTLETITSGVVSFLSQYNTLGSFGLGLNVDDVDIQKHIEFKNSFLSNFIYRFYLREEIKDGREFIEKQIYQPTSCYSLPTDREGLARTSVGIHKPPVPGQNVITLGVNNITNPKDLSIERSVNKNFYNSVVTLYEDKPLDEELRRRVITISGTNQVPRAGNRTLVIESLGLKDFWSAKVVSSESNERLLQRYESAAEYMNGVQCLFADGVQLVVGDILVLDPSGLNLIDNETQSRDKKPLLMEVTNRDIDIKNGRVNLELTSTAFNIDARFGLISPHSLINTVINQTKFVITYQNGPSIYGAAEWRKWSKLNNAQVRVRKLDYSDFFDTSLVNVTSNTVTITGTPTFTVTAGDIIEFANYSLSTDQQKLIYAYLSDDANDFPDGQQPYQLL